METLTFSFGTVDFKNGSIAWNFGCYSPKLERRVRSAMSFWGLYQDASIITRLYLSDL